MCTPPVLLTNLLFDVGNQSAHEIQICSPANDDEGRESEQPRQDLGVKVEKNASVLCRHSGLEAHVSPSRQSVRTLLPLTWKCFRDVGRRQVELGTFSGIQEPMRAVAFATLAAIDWTLMFSEQAARKHAPISGQAALVG